VPGGWSHSAVRPCSADVSLPRLGAWRGTGAAGQAPKTAPTQNNNPAPVTGTVTDRAQAPSTVSKAAGCPEAQPLSPCQCWGPGQTLTGALLLLSGQTLLAHGAGRVIGGLQVQPAALRGASDVSSRTGDRRPRPRALCCTKCSCRSIRFFGYSGVGQPCRPRPRPHTDHSFGLSAAATLATGSPHLWAVTRAAATRWLTTLCDQLPNWEPNPGYWWPKFSDLRLGVPDVPSSRHESELSPAPRSARYPASAGGVAI
jgi:hypothetical protein